MDKDMLNYAFDFLTHSIRKVKRISLEDKAEWFIQQLKDKREMFIVEGALGFGINNPKLIYAFSEAVNSNKEISIICGSKILTNSHGQNDLFNYLLSNDKPNLKTYGVSIKDIPSFHYIHNGRNVLIEQPHLPTDILSPDFIVENSILWHNRLKIDFKNLLKKELVSISQLEELTFEQMRGYENSEDFKKEKLRIFKAQDYSNQSQ
jgi:hypothetical protein